MECKYIVINGADGFEHPYLFSPIENHSKFTVKIIKAGESVTGAGFASLGELGIFCSGESVSLNVKSRGARDEAVFKMMFKKY